MPRNTSSKRSKAARTQAAAARDAKEYKNQQALAESEAGQRARISAAPAFHGVAKTTLYDRSKGVQAKKDAQTGQLALSPAAETAFVDHIRRCSTSDFPQNPADVRDFALSLKSSKAGGSVTEKIENDDPFGFFETLPVASSSRH